jgi:ethanolamine ammonia-lyase small subunit
MSHQEPPAATHADPDAAARETQTAGLAAVDSTTLESATPLVSIDPWAGLRRFTRARIALGRAGQSLPTGAALAFLLAHARARDAVHAELDVDALVRGLDSMGLPHLALHSVARDRAEYLRRPDFGRCLDASSIDTLDAHRQADGADVPADVIFVLADGLSALAVERHALPTLAAVLPLLPGWRLAPMVIARQARVALGDEIGGRLGARCVVMMIGERPGLSSPDSLGLYVTHAPRPGLTDAARNCISNVGPQGLKPEAAARKLAWLLHRAEQLGQTGVLLKDGSDEAPQLA